MKNKWVKTGVVALSVAFAAAALTGCESRQDAARKPDVVEPMVQSSIEACTIAANDTKAAYGARLREVLMDVHTKDLDTLREKNVTVCLDSRQENQTEGFFDQNILGVLYNANPTQPVLGLYDNFNKGGFFTTKTHSYGSEVVSTLADSYQDNDVPNSITYGYASTYSYYCGKGCTNIQVEWRKAADFDQDSIAKNPQLKTSPLKAQSMKANW